MPMIALGLVLLASCADPSPPDTAAHPPDPIDHNLEDCGSSEEWLPVTPEMKDSNSLFLPAPHPATECPFYRGAWQNFLLATQPMGSGPCQGEPLIKCLPTVDDIFQKYKPLAPGALAPPGMPRGTMARSWLGDIKQAGGRQILIDQNGHTIYYGIHVNQAFVDFVNENRLTNAKAVQDAPAELFFPAGVAEFKTAWQEVDPLPGQMEVAADDDRLTSYINTKAWVPTLSKAPASAGDAAGTMIEDRDHPRLITVRLLAIHSVYTLPGHPEFIWGSMEHTSADLSNGKDSDKKAADGFRDVAPVVPPDPLTGMLQNPDPMDPTNVHNTEVVSQDTFFPVYHAGTRANLGNVPPDERQLEFDPATQTFTNPSQRSSIYRMFPASKSNTIHPDDAVSTLNYNMELVFKKHLSDPGPPDKRQHYRLLGAQWMDKPYFFDTNKPILNDIPSDPSTSTSLLIAKPKDWPNVNQADERDAALAAGGDPSQIAVDDLAANGSDSGFSLTAGEDRMSSTVMESFSQSPDSFLNCFSCHNTMSVTARGVPYDGPKGDPEGIVLLKPKRINVSHIFSEIVLEECTGPDNLSPNPDHPQNGKIALCPPFP